MDIKDFIQITLTKDHNGSKLRIVNPLLSKELNKESNDYSKLI